MNEPNKSIGHQRRKRTIGEVRVDEQEYPDGSVSVFVDNEYTEGTFEDICNDLSDGRYCRE